MWIIFKYQSQVAYFVKNVTTKASCNNYVEPFEVSNMICPHGCIKSPRNFRTADAFFAFSNSELV
jgi:hypothetical protein